MYNRMQMPEPGSWLDQFGRYGDVVGDPPAVGFEDKPGAPGSFPGGPMFPNMSPGEMQQVMDSFGWNSPSQGYPDDMERGSFFGHLLQPEKTKGQKITDMAKKALPYALALGAAALTGNQKPRLAPFSMPNPSNSNVPISQFPGRGGPVPTRPYASDSPLMGLRQRGASYMGG